MSRTIEITRRQVAQLIRQHPDVLGDPLLEIVYQHANDRRLEYHPDPSKIYAVSEGFRGELSELVKIVTTEMENGVV